MRLLHAFAVAAALLAAGCSDDPPTIRSLSYTPNAGIVGAMSSITGSVDYTDSDGDISQWQLDVTAPDGTATPGSPQPISDVTQGPIGMVSFTLTFTPTQSGIYNFNFWIIDLQGRPSNPLAGVIRVSGP